MRRCTIKPRKAWQAKVEELGLVWHSVGEQPYWDESTYYIFSSPEIEMLERATRTLYGMFLEAGQYVLDRDLLGQFGIPSFCHSAVRSAWDAEPPALNYGRFDLGFDGCSPPKLFEFNCDTPTSLLEAAVVQWSWKDEVFPRQDQFTSLHEKLIAKWTDIRPYLPEEVYFTHVADAAAEDTLTTSYMRDLAEAAGVRTAGIVIEDIGWDGRTFRDLGAREMHAIFHLYPWEWLINEEFGPALVSSLDATLWIEPIWKMIWSNKAILPILWTLYPKHENLLEASLQPLVRDHVRKPLLAREGANVEIVQSGAVIDSSSGDYGTEGFVYQQLYRLPGEGDQRPVIGSWIVDGEPAGMGIREGRMITGNTARFVPHIID
jgi:glutathionylspermidine synthase